MDDQHQDIYREPEERGPETPVTPLVELTPAQMRARTWRNTIGFTVVMIVIFALATWFIFMQEEKSRRDEHEVPSVGALMPKPQEEAPRAPVAILPEDLGPAETRTLLPGEEAPRVDGQKMARAMGELRLANDYLRAQAYDQAEARARSALQIWPGMNAALRMLGVIYTQRGQFDQAIAMLEGALKSDPFSAETLNNLATAYMHRGDMAKAEELLQTSMQIRPGYSVANMNMGLLYLAMGQYGAAADYLERALEQMPGEASIRNNLAVALLRLGRYEEARRHLRVLVDDSPEAPAAYFNMAITFTLERNYADALTWVRRGSEHCSPVALKNFLADSDFNDLRGHPEFQSILRDAYPKLPTGPQS
ncbi:MAG: tetratricopeptide repeat protein [Kiritimatiellae bacterium]|nr:tetratricopeptide repeat protein [Kiritimatiellia bacterium]